MELRVDPAQRHAKMRAHTATHLLHFALGELLWSTKQAWSLVDEDYLRFDFAAKQPLTANELQSIESKVNARIRHARDVDVKEMSYDDAIKKWAKAFFEDKYGDVVRVVSIIDNDISLTSIELCGWTHVPNTSHIGSFLITGQEAVASWIRRITAVTWPAVAVHAQTLTNEIQAIADKLDSQPKQLMEKLDKILKEFDQLHHAHEQLQTQFIKNELIGLSKTAPSKNKTFAHLLNISSTPLASHDFKSVVNQAKLLWPDVDWIIATNEGNYAVSSWKEGLTAKEYTQKNGLKWGGSDHLIQGRDPKILELFT